MKLTPLHLEILLHHFVSTVAFRHDNECVQNARNDLMTLELLDSYEASGFFLVTDKGKAWLEHVLATPMPTHKWVWE